MVSETPKTTLLSACGRVLEPIVRFLLKRGVSWREFSDLAKAVFVQVATADFGIRARPTNVSRVAILTGLDRREVRRVRDLLGQSEAQLSGYMSKPSQVLDGWHHDTQFIDSSGKPLVLPFEGPEPSFTTLVKRFAPALPAVAMFKELKSAGAVTRLSDGSIQVLLRSYIPRHIPAEQVRLWSSVLRDHAAAVDFNLSRKSDQRSLFERRAINLHVDARALPEFREFLEQEGQQFLERMDDWLSKHRVDLESDRASVRLGVGVYQIQDSAD
jgi:hypothetical protein